ncbi:MAG: hypothetical protein FJ279_23355 [Planctomycetes bacterium]|nr:hypothetical protein [Planctomycetota bacterium]
MLKTRKATRAKKPASRRRKSRRLWDGMEFYTDPIDEWLSKMSSEWSEKYPGKYLAIIDTQLVPVCRTRRAAYAKLEALYPERFYARDWRKAPLVWYVPRAREMEMVLFGSTSATSLFPPRSGSSRRWGLASTCWAAKTSSRGWLPRSTTGIASCSSATPTECPPSSAIN